MSCKCNDLEVPTCRWEHPSDSYVINMKFLTKLDRKRTNNLLACGRYDEVEV